jgi:CheY-like chemotaxis protein
MLQLDKPTRLIRIPSDELETIIQRLHAAMKSAAERTQRTAERHAIFKRNVPICISQPGGSTLNYLVDAYSLSAGGLGFIHGGYIHSGSQCFVRLGTVDNAWQELKGVVARCGYLERGLHDVGLAWTGLVEPLNMADFIASASSKQASVLLVEDDPMMAKLAVHFLEKKARANVELATTCAEARSRFDARERSLVFVDIDLPDGSGVDLMNEWKPRGTSAFFVAFTSHSDEASKLRIMAAGFDAFVAKPFTAEDLLKVYTTTCGDPIESTLRGDEDLDDLIRAFVASLAGEVDAVRQAIVRDQIEKAQSTLRRLRSSAASFGYGPLSDAAAELESHLFAQGSQNADVATAAAHLVMVSRRVIAP